MRKSRSFISAALLVMLGGCHENPEPDHGPPPDAGAFLSDEPLWTLEPPEALLESCFGSSVALGDVNGDGKDDLVVAAPPCRLSPGQGHLLIYPGNGSTFSGEPFITELDWRNPNPRATGRNSAVELGDVNGDRFADILIRSQTAGTLVFAGGEDLAAVLQAPLFRMPYLAIHRSSHLIDLDGEGLDELVILQGSQVSIHRATPEGPEPFVLWKTLPEQVLRLVRAGDTNGDGAEDLLLVGAVSQLHLGCKPEVPGVCEAGLSVQPSWTASEAVTGFFPDQNGDGLAEVVLSEVGRVRVYLFQPEGGLSPTPIWTQLGDAAAPGFAGTPLFVGDLDRDGTATEFLLGTNGRLYAFFPGAAVSSELRAGWAWPRSDSLGPDFPGYVRYSVIPAGDLNGDGFADLIAGLAPPYDTLAPTELTRPGKVVAFGGGRLPPESPAPSLREPTVCGLASSGEGKPDVTVDTDVIARSLLVDRRDFAETACEVVEGCVDAPGNRRLLRFSVSIPNLGRSSVRIPSPQERPDLYYFDVCHQHDHLTGFASYELLDTQSEVRAVGRKQGFYMVDLTPYCADAGAAAFSGDGSQTISPGWADVYVGEYPCQWLDITDVPDGEYTLRVGVDANDLIDEEDSLPNSVEVRVRLSGDSVEYLP